MIISSSFLLMVAEIFTEIRPIFYEQFSCIF